MHKKERPISRDQARHEVAAGHGFLLWIAVYLVLTLAFVIADHPGAHHAIASHNPADSITAPGRAGAPDHPSSIARGS